MLSVECFLVCSVETQLVSFVVILLVIRLKLINNYWLGSVANNVSVRKTSAKV